MNLSADVRRLVAADLDAALERGEEAMLKRPPAVVAADLARREVAAFATLSELTEAVSHWQRRMFWFATWRTMTVSGIFGSAVRAAEAGHLLSYDEAKAIAAQPPIYETGVVDGQDWPGDDGTTIGILVVTD